MTLAISNKAAMLHLAHLYTLYNEEKLKNHVRGYKGVVRVSGPNVFSPNVSAATAIFFNG